jgi:signal transduction histidine kinase
MKILSAASLLLTMGLVGLAAIRQPGLDGRIVLPWALLVAFAEMAPIHSSADSPWLSLDLPLLLGAAFVLGPALSGGIAFLGSLDTHEFRREISIYRAVYNRSQTALSVMAAAATFTALGGHVGGWPWTAVAALAALCVDCVVNYSLVGIGTALSTGRPILSVVSSMHIGPAEIFVPTYASFGFLGVLLAEAYVAVGFWGVVAFAAPLLLARGAFLHRHKFESVRSSLDARGQALRRVDERIADERKDERSRIAEALHDEVLQHLYNVSLRTQVLREDLRAGRLLSLDDDLPAVIESSEQAIDELRDVIRGLRRSPVGQAGLADTISLLVDHLRDQSGMNFIAQVEPIEGEPADQLLIYQIAREALQNAVKHSKARAVWVSLTQESQEVVIRVEDDGVGFDASVAHGDGRHFGLELIKERTDSLGGTLQLTSSPGCGVVIEIRIPR